MLNPLSPLLKALQKSLQMSLVQGALVLLGIQALPLAAQAQGMPEVSPTLKKMLGGLPIAGIKDEVHGMVEALKKTPCGGGLRGCYTTSSGPLQLYFFTSEKAQQTFLLVINQTIAMPPLLKENVQKVFGNTSLSSPIISISTADFALDTVKMPPSLQTVVRDNYFNVSSLSFAAGVQLAARADLGGAIKLLVENLGVRANQLTLRAAVVMPIPQDLTSGAGSAAGLADAMSHGDTMKKAGADALKPQAYVEFQFPPNTQLPMSSPVASPMTALMPPMIFLSDATFFIDNSLVFGYKGNATFNGVGDKRFLLHFMTPLTPAGAMDLLDFQFRLATPNTITLEDAAHVMFAMATPDPRLTKYGGGFIRNIESYKNALLALTKPLSVFQVQNPIPAPAYRFGDSSTPWPNDPKYFNIALLGPTAPDGPYMALGGNAVILGQNMARLDASAGTSGLHGLARANIAIKLGPLGKVTVRMDANVDIDKDKQNIALKGNFAGQAVDVVLNATKLKVNVSASCVNPFEINTEVAFQAKTNIADVFEGQGGANVDPAKINGCIGKDLEAAYKKIAGEYKNLSGYTASAANAELKKIGDAATAAAAATAAELQKQQDAARREYEKSKDTARKVANDSANAANQALKAADNVFKGFGKKKRHKKEPDPKFASSVFDWDYYYDQAPDVVKRNADLATHWRDNGLREGRRGSLEFDVKYYRARYLDVQQLCGATDYACVLNHWLDEGLPAGRQGSADFSVASYIDKYSDMRQQFGMGDYVGAMEQWLSDGADAGRNGRPASSAPGPVMGPVRIGGSGGGAWSDEETCNGQHVIGWRLLAGRTVDRVQFKYPRLKVGPIKYGGWASAHGNSGDAKATSDVSLDEGEYIVRVDYRSGSRIDGLSFTTNTGQTYGPFGGTGGNSGRYTVTPGEKLGCMSGRSGSSTDQLTFTSTGPR